MQDVQYILISLSCQLKIHISLEQTKSVQQLQRETERKTWKNNVSMLLLLFVSWLNHWNDWSYHISESDPETKVEDQIYHQQ